VIRLEDEIEDRRYVSRVELAGIDPAKNINIAVRGRQLMIPTVRKVVPASHRSRQVRLSHVQGHPGGERSGAQGAGHVRLLIPLWRGISDFITEDLARAPPIRQRTA